MARNLVCGERVGRDRYIRIEGMRPVWFSQYAGGPMPTMLHFCSWCGSAQLRSRGGECPSCGGYVPWEGDSYVVAEGWRL